MARFLYYLPGVPGASTAMLVQRGLWPRFSMGGGAGGGAGGGGGGGQAIEYGVTQTLAGPDGGAGGGCLLAAGADGAAYDGAGGQQWVQGKDFWVGVEAGGDAMFAPGPDDLARETGITGGELVLGDGRTWRVPWILSWDRQRLDHVANLPTAMVMREGKVMVEVAPAYREVFELGQQILADFMAGRTITLEELLRRAARLLAVNYRVGMEECALLGLFDQEKAVEVLGAAIDVPSMLEQSRELATRGMAYIESEE